MSNIEALPTDLPKAVLLINRTDSRCSACSGNAWMSEYRHRQKKQGERGCGAVFIGVSSSYTGMEHVVPGLRPDLTWYDPMKGEWPEDCTPPRLW